MRLDLLARIALAPLLLVQALRTRARTPKLPEALGAHTGQTGTGPALRLLLVGDSTMAGVGSAHLDEALAGQLCARLAPHYTLHWHIHARTGATTRATAQSLPPHPCDMAVVSLGVNDVTSLVPLRRWLAQTKALITQLRAQGAQAIHLSAVPPMGRFPALPQPLAWVLGAQAARMNAALAQMIADEMPDVVLHTLSDLPLGEGAVARDGYHPGPATYALWAEQVASQILTHKSDNSPAA